jgi:hypothetical protein
MNYNPYSFISTDVIVWNGVIGQFGSFSPFINEGDNLRKANDEELKNYKSSPDKSPYEI